MYINVLAANGQRLIQEFQNGGGGGGGGVVGGGGEERGGGGGGGGTKVRRGDWGPLRS